MNPQIPSASGSGFSQPGNDDVGQLPPIHTPDTFRAPDSQMSHFSGAVPGGQLPPAPVVAQPAFQAPVAQPAQPSPPAVSPPSIPAPIAADMQAQAFAQAAPAAPAEEPDTALDEEWVGKARQAVEHLHNDPFLESKELNKLKAQYIKARYNKDIKISEG